MQKVQELVDVVYKFSKINANITEYVLCQSLLPNILNVLRLWVEIVTNELTSNLDQNEKLQLKV